MNREEKKQLAYSLYVKSSGKSTRKELAKQIGVTEKTLRSWVELGEWELQKEAMQITRPQLLMDAYAQLKAINQHIEKVHKGVPTKELSDAKASVRKEIELFSTMALHKYIEVFEEFVGWLVTHEPSKIKEWDSLSQRFISELSKQK